jgi:Plasma-membrane choline transporter
MEPDYVGGRGGDRNESLGEKLLESQFILHNDDDEEQPLHHPTDAAAGASNSAAASSGELQPNRYRDVWAAVLFGLCQAVLLYLALAWGIPAVTGGEAGSGGGDGNGEDPVSLNGVLAILMVSSIAAMGISAAALAVLLRFAKQLIQLSLISSMVCNGLVVLILLAQGLWLGAVGALILLGLTALYAHSVWRRIPFATANLETAITAVQSNGSLFLLACGVTGVVLIMSLIWVLAWVGVYARHATCDDKTHECAGHTSPLVSGTLLLLYFWNSTVGKNVLHVTVAGVVGTFIFAPQDAGSFCSPAVNDSLVRASTFSFGSICLGSLLTAILQLLHHAARAARQHRRVNNELLLCMLECIAGFLERLVSFFNKWSYVYIGLYGYDYLTAGQKVMALFGERGWIAIINDNLVNRVLVLACVVIGALTGCVGLFFSGWVSEFGGAATLVAFGVPFLLGTAMASIFMGVVESAVDTVVVCFAEAPLEFERNHPGLFAQMATAWRQVYPEEFSR